MLDCRKSESSFKILYWIKGISCNYSKVWVTGTESGGRLDNPVSSVFFPPPTSPVQKAWAEFCVSSAGFGGNSSKQKCPCRETEYWPEGKGAQESPFTVVYGEGKSAQGWCSTEVLNTLISLTSLLCWVTRLTSCSLLLSLTSLHTHTHTHTHEHSLTPLNYKCKQLQEFACQRRRCKRQRFCPCIRNIPCMRKWQPTPAFLLGKSHGQRNLEGYHPWICKESDTTEWLSKQLYGENNPMHTQF